MLAVFAGVECYLRLKIGASSGSTFYQWFFWARCFLFFIGFARLMIAIKKGEDSLIGMSIMCSITYSVFPAMFFHGIALSHIGILGRVGIILGGLIGFIFMAIMPFLPEYIFDSNTDMLNEKKSKKKEKEKDLLSEYFKRNREAEEERWRRQNECWQRRQNENRSTYKW